MVREFDIMQEEDFRIQKDMFIRIEDMKLLNVDARTIKKILEKAGTDETLIRNLMRGIFTPTNYSEPRFDQKVEYVRGAMEEQSEKSDKYFFFENEAFIFPKTELDAVKRDWKRKEFFPDGYTLTKLNTKRIQRDKPFMMQTVILFQKKDQVSLKKVWRKLKNLLIL